MMNSRINIWRNEELCLALPKVLINQTLSLVSHFNGTLMEIKQKTDWRTQYNPSSPPSSLEWPLYKGGRNGIDYFYLSHISPSSLPSHQCNIMLTHRERLRIDRRDIGEMTGGMKGEIKTVKSLYLKVSATSDGRDGPLFVNTRSLFENKAPLLFNNHAFIVSNHSF